ncbi:MAG: hypothetical protein ACOVO1_04225 [Chitinophagaceae bacterium]
MVLHSCTKYVAKNTSQTSTSTGTSGSTQGATPTGGNTSSGSSGTGGSSSGGNTGSSTGGSTGTGTGGSTSGGGTSSGGGSTGTGTGGSTSGNNNGSANIPQTYLQGFNYSNLANSSIYANDSIQLLANGYYTSLKAGSLRFGLVWGNHNSTTLATYFLNPYSFYSYFVFDETTTTLGETILNNGSINATTNLAQVRFINIDPTTKNSSITFKLNNGNDKLTIPNRTYLDNKTDSTLANFININPSTAVVEFEVNGQVIKSFNQYFQGGKKYTVLAAYSKQYSYSTYFVAQHN